jgi:rhodanese-related sulfurtransferase
MTAVDPGATDPVVTDPAASALPDEVAAALSKVITLEEAADLFAEGRALFVDARDAQSYADGHIQGAISLPLMTFPQGLDEIRHGLDGMTVITYCDGERCTLSRDLAEALRVEGVENVRELRNGWTLWQEQGLPTATEHGGGQS